MEDEIAVTVIIRGLADRGAGARKVVNVIKRSLFLTDGRPGEFGAEISVSGGPVRISERLGPDGRWIAEST